LETVSNVVAPGSDAFSTGAPRAPFCATRLRKVLAVVRQHRRGVIYG
jgi:hypothetical protein